MKVLYATVVSLLITVTQALASGGGEGESLSLLTIFFMGFGALILVFQLVPAIVLLGGMLRGVFSPAFKKTDEALAGSPDKRS